MLDAKFNENLFASCLHPVDTQVAYSKPERTICISRFESAKNDQHPKINTFLSRSETQHQELVALVVN